MNTSHSTPVKTLAQQLSHFLLCAAACMTALLSTASPMAHAQQALAGLVPHAVASSRVTGPLPSGTRLNLAIGLPLRNQNELDALLAQATDPASVNFGHHLSVAQFAAEFGPTEQDYQALIQFAHENNLAVTATYPNRVLLDVSGDVSDIERAMHVKMTAYDHPVRGHFYAPDREPTIGLETRILDISGLDNFVLPHPMSLRTVPLSEARSYVTGSGPGGNFIGRDFRAAYAPGVSLTGSGQVVGLLEFDGFYAGDVQKNAAQAGLPAVPTQTVLLNGSNGSAGGANIEVILDIMMASYMAPGLAKVMVYEGYTPNDILNRMATDNLAQQLSSSWGYGPVNATTEQIFKEFILQGQSMLQASGDSGAYSNGVMAPSDDPSLTVVGGTSLATAGAGGPWQSEKTWAGSGGGVSTVYPLPSWQQGLSMAANGGSTKMRNIPDVALTADLQIFLIQSNGQAVVVGGTSAAAPLWAGFAALANQQAAANRKQRVGFLNPLLYQIGEHSSYTSDFNDIRNGNDNGFSAVSGYDLATGWGSPAGQHLINDLTSSSAAASFALSSSVPTVTVNQAGKSVDTITVNAANNFSGSVNLRVSGLPSGVTASFSPANTGSASSLTFQAVSTAPTGTHTVTVTGVSGALSSMTTIALTVAAPNFTLSLSGASLSLPRGSTASETATIAGQDGFSGSVSLSLTGLPSGVTGTIGTITGGVSQVTFAASSMAAAGNYPIVLNGVSGLLKNSTSFALSVVVPPAGTIQVNLAAAYNVNAMVVDGVTFSGGGLDGGLNGTSTAYSANLIGAQQTIRGTLFLFGPANVPDAVSARVVALAAGKFSAINLLATAVNGGQAAQAFKVTYSDGTSSIFTQGVSDWFVPAGLAGETKALTMGYRDTSQGQRDNRTFYLYEYTFALNATKTVASITLPNNRNVIVLAASLAGPSASARPKYKNR